VQKLEEELSAKGDTSNNEKLQFLKLEVQMLQSEKSALNNEKIETKRRLERKEGELAKSKQSEKQLAETVAALKTKTSKFEDDLR